MVRLGTVGGARREWTSGPREGTKLGVPTGSFLLKGGLLSVATRGSVAALVLAATGAVVTSCGGDEFCQEGSYECSTAPTAGTGASSGSGGSSGTSGTTGGGGTAASETGGSSAVGGTSAAGGQGGASGTADGGTAGALGSSGTGDTGGGGAAGSDDHGPVVCDPSAPVATCVPPSKGVFVSTSGDDGNTGNQDSPFKTLGKALVAAAAADPATPIFVCGGTYHERLVVTTAGIAIHGGYSCTDLAWSYDGVQASIAPYAEGEVLKVDGADGFAATDLEIIAHNATAPGTSSVGVFVKDSSGVTLTRVHVVAGTGADGADGDRADYLYMDLSDLKGNDADSNSDSAGGVKSCTCEGPGPQSIGAAGGVATQAGGQGEPTALGGGEPGMPGESCTNGGRGADAEPVADGEGAQSIGAISASGWNPESGQEGNSGAPGQGGGGGGGAKSNGSGAGGGGACGGCGGRGGAPGGGGGASIALLVLRSDVDIVDSKLEAKAAGNGGAGTGGQPGQQGGVRGKASGAACIGGNGGNGADGGGAGGGAGGISIGILESSSTVGVNPATIIWIGKKGDGGPGGGADNSGIPGIEEKRQTL